MLHELDSALRALVERELGDDADVEIDFDAPTKDWASHRNRPTIDIYLYDIRQDVSRYQFGTLEQRDANRIVTDRRPMPKFFRVAYLVTAWTQRAEDEHRLLSGLMSTFLMYEAVPPELLGGSLGDLGFSVPLAVALPPPQDRALSDVWSALGGELKPSLDVSLVAPLLPERFGEAGPPVSRRPLISMSDTVSGAKEEHGGAPMTTGPLVERAAAAAEATPDARPSRARKRA
jgi:Pvc16 N-terminal domain